MWTRAELKYYAKAVLRNYYWWAIVAILIVSGIVLIASLPVSILNFVTTMQRQLEEIRNGVTTAPKVPTSNPIFSFFSIAVTIFLAFPLSVGLSRFFLNIRENKLNIADVFSSFNKNYLSIVGAMAWQYLFTVLWTLLFIVPGIIKGISYSMTPYILADNPTIGYKRAIKLSMAMTEGQKGEIFVLCLSFIGWALLGAIVCCGIGDFFLMPYIKATFAELYVKLRTNALNRGVCTPEELNLTLVGNVNV